MVNEHAEAQPPRVELPVQFRPDVFIIRSGMKGKQILDQEKNPLFATRKEGTNTLVQGTNDEKPSLIVREEKTKPFDEQNKWTVIDPETEKPLGQIRNLKMWQKPRAVSQVYELMNPEGTIVQATITERSELASLMNGLTMGLRDVVAPHFFTVRTEDQEIAQISVSAGIKGKSITLRYVDQNALVDRRMILAACLL